MVSNEIAIHIEGLSKRYKIGKQRDGSLRGSLRNLFSSTNSNFEEFWALKDVSFDVRKGDVVGIIGKNGAGKSTLLKILSQITLPTEGRIEINGRIASLLEVGTGFHAELTGRENIYLNGTILGMSRKEVKQKFNEIVAFSGIEKFIDTPVKHYSSGMYVRLAFSVAAHLEPEILIIDEVLAVGDAEFQRKCLGKMKDVANQGRTVLFVSHNMAAIMELCNYGIMLKNGRLHSIGAIESTISDYLISDIFSSSYIPKTIKTDIPVAFKKIEIVDENNKNASDFTCKDIIKIKFSFLLKQQDHPYNLFVIINNKYGAPVFSAEKHINNSELILALDRNFLTRGNYSLHTFIHIPRVEQIDVAKDVCGFNITDATSPLSIHGDYEYGNVFGNYTWEEL